MAMETHRGWSGRTVVRRTVWVLACMLAMLAVVVACLIFAGPLLGSVIMGTAFSPTLPQSPSTGYYAKKTVDTVHVTRTEDTASPDQISLDRTITDAQATQALYNAAFALPDYPSGTMNCPLGTNDTYHLAFSNHGSAVLTVIADGSGCQVVTLVGLGDRMANDGFWRALADALGVTEDGLWTPFPHSP
ncbi:MAG TPA: hypothetical protein VFQ25_07080 [Ktedonobacterales bacterium]|nr:hypothetical protein [Ktedonobacterales bacterium]